ncbi:translational machinery component [Laetiporus sulphureus 93-53]|uniref:Translational machinery component n=1 Tax=Laetiporus sulphureus 93-53 TaxID=1314785 RepID=A0A165ICW7_9APHY|nr:translational machinery component [Laetiporus sulphureus 93-53]KZT12907.1 translational machinery component [Laetiporus sulphureus 93-53]
MSLLTRRIFSLSLPRRSCGAAYLSTEGSIESFFDSLAKASTAETTTPPTTTLAADEGPPIGEMYPKQEFQNPLRAVGTAGRYATYVSEQRPIYSVHVKSSRTNTIITLTRPNRTVLKTLTGGSVGFKGSNRSSYEAGYKCAVGVFERLQQEMGVEDLSWQLFYNGFGTGREAMQKALTGDEGLNVKSALVRITDNTPIKIGGTRSKKAKRR